MRTKLFPVYASFNPRSLSYLASSVFHVTYNLDVKEDNDPYLTTALEVILGGSLVEVPGAFLVDVFPIRGSVVDLFP